jgi:hypothetical protein
MCVDCAQSVAKGLSLEAIIPAMFRATVLALVGAKWTVCSPACTILWPAPACCHQLLNQHAAVLLCCLHGLVVAPPCFSALAHVLNLCMLRLGHTISPDAVHSAQPVLLRGGHTLGPAAADVSSCVCCQSTIAAAAAVT